LAWDLDAAIGVLITQIGGRKQKTVPISEIAKAAAYASHELGSAQKVAERIRRPTARAQINDFVAINSLPPDVKSHLVGKRKFGI